MMDDVFGVPLSVGTISPLEQVTTAAVAAPVEEARTFVHEQGVAHLDETSGRQGDKRAWLWVAVTSWVTVFVVRLSRGGHVARVVGRDVFRHLGHGSLQCLQWVPGAVASAVLGALAAGLRSDARPWGGLRGAW
jgi:hypothetical protein